MTARGWLLALFCCAALAQPLRVDPAAARRPISRDIYGICEYGEENGFGRFPFTARRWGGDNSVSYNWKLDSNNTASNWFFETFPVGKSGVENPSWEKWVRANRENGARSVLTVPVIGWTTNTRESKRCSYSVAKYGPQEKTDVWAPDCGNGMKPDGRTAIVNDPLDVYEPVGPEFAEEWVRRSVELFGTAEEGGVWLWELDNEPVWWHAVHRDIHPEKATFAEMLDSNIRWAEAVKRADPTAKVGGPKPGGWESYFYSAKDLYAGWSTGPDWKYWNNPSDCKANSPGGECTGFIPWYLDRMREYEEKNGLRLVDYLDIHGYLAPDNFSSKHEDSRPEMDELRLRSTRTFWDPDYMPPRADMAGMDRKWGTGTPQIIRRMRKWIDEHYPGTKLAITEYNWGAQDHITGALAQADLFGIFGREGLDLATVWGTPKADEPAAFAWRIMLDYDGAGAGFGETSVEAVTEDADRLAVYAAERADGTLTVLVINKTRDAIESPLAIAGLSGERTAGIWRYSEAEAGRIVRADDVQLTDGQASVSWPGWSLSLVVVRPTPPPPSEE